MPSPPAPVSSLPPGDRGRRRSFARRRGRRHGTAWRRGAGGRRRRGGRASPCARRGRGRRGSWPLAGEQVERGDAVVVEARDGPAVAAVGSTYLLGRARGERAALGEQAGDVGAAGGGGARGRRRWRQGGLGRRRRRRRTGCAGGSCALADQGMSSASRHSQSVASSVHRSRRVRPRRDAGEQGLLERGVGEEGAAGARVDDAERARRRRRSGGARRPRRPTMTTAREPMCFSSQTTVPMPAPR
jgi:hypothetical protein